jgi:hypothetical protein
MPLNDWLIVEDSKKCEREASQLVDKFNALREALRSKFPSGELEYAMRNALHSKTMPDSPFSFPAEAGKPTEALADTLAKDFRGMHHTSESIAILFRHCEEPDTVRRVMYDLVAERDLRRQFEALPLGSFSDELKKEREKRAEQLKIWNEVVRETASGDQAFDSVRLFDDIGYGLGRVFRSEPFLMPNFATSGISGGRYNEPNTPWLVGDSTRQGVIGDTGYTYGIGFGELNIPGSEYKTFPALVCVDRRILSPLLAMKNDKDNPAQQKLATNLISNFREFFNDTIHDFVHQCMFSDTKGYGHRNKFQSADPPLYKDGKRLELDNAIWINNDDAVNDSVASPLERHAELTYRLIWEKIFQKEPKQKMNRIHQATEFLVELENYRKLQVGKVGKENADNMASYLAILAMGRFFRPVNMDDPDLEKLTFDIKGRRISFKQAADELQLPAYAPVMSDIQDNIADDPMVKHVRRSERISFSHPFMDSGRSSSPSLPDESNAVQRLRKWTGKEFRNEAELEGVLQAMRQNESPRLTGMDGLQARVILQGSHIPGWLHRFPVTEYLRNPAREAAEYFKRVTDQQFIAERPSFREALEKRATDPSGSTPTTHPH